MKSMKGLKIIFSSSSPSALKIASNDDLLLEILTRLPVKSLLKFKCVSKHWLSLISNPKFYRRGYLSHSPCICGLFLDPRSHGTYQSHFINLHCKHGESLDILYPPHKSIFRSCNGLLLCCDNSLHRSPPIYSVYNPTTKHCITLPPLSQIGEILDISLAFDPLKSPDYKVICLRLYENEEADYQIDIYSSKSGRWRLSETKISLDWDNAVHGGEFWNGGIHWYTDFGPCFYFDVDEDKIKEMPMPNPVPDDCSRRRAVYFGESRGHLHLVEIYDLASTEFDVWELQKDYSCWSIKYRVNLDGLVSEYPGMMIRVRDYVYNSQFNRYVLEILCIAEGETEEDSYMVLHIPANIIRYDFKTQKIKKLCDFPPTSPPSSSWDHRQDENAENFLLSVAFPYIESLVGV